MKYVSIFFSVMMICPITFFSLHIYELYDSKGPLKLFGVDNKLINQMATKPIVFLIVYTVTLTIAIFLNVKRRYTTNTILLSVMILFYMVTTFFNLA